MMIWSWTCPGELVVVNEIRLFSILACFIGNR